jgi:predicted ribonuclease toxin of YeeF-YezG toxin-antitoxin module
MEQELRSTATSFELSLSENEVNDYATLLERMEKSLQTVSDMQGEFEKTRF